MPGKGEHSRGLANRPMTDNHRARRFLLLIDDMADFGNLMRCARRCARGVRWKASVQNFEINKLRWIARLSNQIEDKTYKSMGFKRFDVNERGKIRHIQSVHISERVVQKALVNYVLKPYVLPEMIYDNSASQEGKGTEFALKRLKKHLTRHYQRHGLQGGILIMDFHDYFGQIPHDTVIKQIESLLPDDTANYFVELFIDCFDGSKGLGLGSEISQLAAILFPTPIDKYIAGRSNDNARYMDDSYAISDDVDELRKLRQEIRIECEKLGIQLNERKTKIHLSKSDGFEFLKKRVRLEASGKVSMRLTRKNVRDQRKYIRSMKADVLSGYRPKDSPKESYTCWRGYAKKYNAYRTIGTMDKYFKETMKEAYENGANSKRCEGTERGTGEDQLSGKTAK